MATEAYANIQTVSTTEWSLPNDAAYSSASPMTAGGVYQVFVDCAAIVVGDQFRIRVYEKVRSTGTQRVVFEAYITGPVAPTWVSPTLILMNGWDVSILKILGTDRSIEWSIRSP